MDKARRASLSLSAFILICFFLPWVELSCLGLRDSASGLDLARSGDRLLWLVPLSMVIVLVLGFTRLILEKMPAAFALMCTVGGSISAYLMFRERLSTDRRSGLISGQMTVWFWLGLIASLGLIATALLFYARRSRSP